MKVNAHSNETQKSSFFRTLCHLWKKVNHQEEETVRKTIEDLIEESNEIVPSIESDERQILGNVLGLRDLTVDNVMTHRNDIIAVPSTISIDNLLSTFLEKNVTRILVYQENLDNIIGFVHIKDLLGWYRSQKNFKINTIIKDVLFIVPSMRTLDLLLQMRRTGSKIAIVVDEYGGVDGLVTFSNLIEEIIGDIQDVNESAPAPHLEIKNDGTIIADARTKIEDFEEIIGAPLPLSDFEKKIETLGGLVYFTIGRIPVCGELVRHSCGIEFEILDADLRRLKKLKIHKIPELKKINEEDEN